MIGEREQLVDRIYTCALELAANERRAYVERTCTDPSIRVEVLRLLEAATSDRLDRRLDAVRERVWGDVVAGDRAPEEDLAGQRIGHWRIERRLARGGLATVYLAHRDDGQFEQAAAFKVLRRGLDTDDVVARFRAERQILSSLDHPAIANILDGGALPDSRPYLVLEYVDGEPITGYCDQQGIDVRGRVALIIDVLRALHHAHRHTVVHRDIKPSNMLVSREGNVVLLDFGIAKLLDPEALPGTSTLTRTGMSLLTPGYGSPEQRAGQAVTTASDIYQAGIVLYELLAGERPAFTDSNGQVTDPSPPSRRIEDPERVSQVRGDLDAIVRMALQVDPSRRYASASEMAADLERYLDGLPVVAQPDTLGYRLRMLMRRRPWLLPASAIAVLGVAAYVITLTVYSRQLRLEEQRAEAAQAFMVDLIRSPDPFAPADPERGRNITVVEALELGKERLDGRLSGNPELRANLFGSLASVYQSLDQNEQAIELAEEALALNTELYGERSEAVLEDLRLLADQHNVRGDQGRASAYSDKQLEIARASYDAADPRLGVAEVAAGTLAISQGEMDSGLELLEDGIRILRLSPDAHPETLLSAIITSTERHGMNDAVADLPLLEEALQIAESSFGPETLHVARLRIAIGRNALYAHRYAQSEENYQNGLRIMESRLGSNHGSMITALQDYAASLNVTGNHAAAEGIYRDLLSRLVAARGETHRSVADAYQNLATTITYQRRYAESVPMHRKAYNIYSAVLDDDNYIIAFPLLSIASIELERNNPFQAEASAREALERLHATVPDTYVEGVARCLVGLSLEQQGNAVDGSAMVEASHELILKRDILVPKYLKLCRVPGVGGRPRPAGNSVSDVP